MTNIFNFKKHIKGKKFKNSEIFLRYINLSCRTSMFCSVLSGIKYWYFYIVERVKYNKRKQNAQNCSNIKQDGIYVLKWTGSLPTMTIRVSQAWSNSKYHWKETYLLLFVNTTIINNNRPKGRTSSPEQIESKSNHGVEKSITR